MNVSKTIILITSLLALACFSFAFYLSKYQKDPFATLDFNSSGCFHSESYRLKLYNHNGSTLATLDSSGINLKKSYISNTQLDSFYSFSKKLEQFNDDIGGCTTYEYYKLFLKEKFIEKTDANCNWFGFWSLKNYLF